MRHPVEIFVSLQAACMILPLWRQGKNTLEIAQALSLPEYEIANRLPGIREQQGDKMKGITWTEELTDRLKSLYETGLSSSQIAAEMNCGISRNAVIGKTNRMGLTRSNGHENRTPSGRSPRHQTYKPREKRATIRFIRCNSNSNAMRVVDTVEFDAAEMRCAEVEPKHVGLLDLDSDGCRYPFGDSPFTFCNHKQLAGSSYCPSHFFLAIGPGTTSEKAATKISAVHLEPFA